MKKEIHIKFETIEEEEIIITGNVVCSAMEAVLAITFLIEKCLKNTDIPLRDFMKLLTHLIETREVEEW